MFCVLNVENQNLTFCEKIFKFLRKDQYSIRSVPVFKGAPFYVINALISSDEINWDLVVKCAGKCAKRLVVSDNIEVPQRNDISIFKSQRLYNQAFQNTLLQILEMNKFAENPQYIAVLDNWGNNTDFVEKVSKYASNLTVITKNESKYDNLCEDLLEQTGMCITLRSDFDNSKVKIDLERNVMSVDVSKSFINIAKGENLKVSEVYKKLVPTDVCELNFYSALYELCGVFALKECIFETVEMNNEKKKVDECYFS